MSDKTIIRLLYVLIGIGIFLRLFQFGTFPSPLNRDEAALSYNAYALAKEGVDEWSQPWPYIFKSFGDYKLPGYIYGLAPVYLLMEPSQNLARLPSLVAGMVLIYLAFLLAKEVSNNNIAALMAATITSLAPWAIFYSRIGFEAHVGLMWSALAIYLMIRPFSTRNLIGIGIAYLLAVVTYNTPLLLAPMLVLFIATLGNKSWKHRAVYAVLVSVIALCVFFLLTPLTSQKQGITIFSDPTIQAQIRDGYAEASTLPQKLLSHWLTSYAVLSISHGFETLMPRFLITHGGSHPWHSQPNLGHLQVTTYILFITGVILMIVYRKKTKPVMWSLLLLAFMALLPAVVTVDAPHATRSLLFFWLVGIIAGLSLAHLRKFVPIILLALFLESLVFVKTYFIDYPNNLPDSWPHAIDTAIDEAKELAVDDKMIVFTNVEGRMEDLLSNQLYIYLLLHDLVLPSEFAKSQILEAPDNVGLTRVRGFDQYLIVNEMLEAPEGSVVIVRLADGSYQLESD